MRHPIGEGKKVALAAALAAGALAGAATLSGSILPPELDPAELEAFVDGYMASYLEESGAVGAAVAIVHDGQIVLAEGYGEDDAETGRDVDADRTLFRVGSVSKLFVWTGVMQLVEQGKLDLDADVNRYLDGVSVPATFPEPITIAHLMTHTPGFEDHVLGLFAREPSALRPLAELLREQMPSRVRPPGETASYSNHGTALAALAIERVAGMPWLDYVERSILEPLGMERTTFRQPPPGALAGDLSKGYRLAGGEAMVEGFEYVPLAPAGAASATAVDMARFMLAHLDHGRLGEVRVLRESTARTMHSRLHGHAAGVPGMAHGFIEGERNGRRVVGHGGDTLWFHTQLELYPEERVGFFASFNTSGAEPQKLAQAFADRYFPAPEAARVAPSAEAAARAARYAGSYRSVRYSHDDFTKVGALLSQVEVRAAADGTLRLSTSGDTRWIEIEPLLFREEDGTGTIAFRAGRGGGPTHLFLGSLPVFAFERVPVWERPELHLALAGGALAVSLLTVLGAPLAWMLRRRQRATSRNTRLPAVARAVVWLGSLAVVAFFAGLLTLGDPLEVVFGVGARLRQILLLPIVIAGLAIGGVLSTLWIWRTKRGRPRSRLAYTLVVVALVALVWQLAVWRFLWPL